MVKNENNDNNSLNTTQLYIFMNISYTNMIQQRQRNVVFTILLCQL